MEGPAQRNIEADVMTVLVEGDHTQADPIDTAADKVDVVAKDVPDFKKQEPSRSYCRQGTPDTSGKFVFCAIENCSICDEKQMQIMQEALKGMWPDAQESSPIYNVWSYKPISRTKSST